MLRKRNELQILTTRKCFMKMHSALIHKTVEKYKQQKQGSSCIQIEWMGPLIDET